MYVIVILVLEPGYGESCCGGSRISNNRDHPRPLAQSGILYYLVGLVMGDGVQLQPVFHCFSVTKISFIYSNVNSCNNSKRNVLKMQFLIMTLSLFFRVTRVWMVCLKWYEGKCELNFYISWNKILKFKKKWILGKCWHICCLILAYLLFTTRTIRSTMRWKWFDILTFYFSIYGAITLWYFNSYKYVFKICAGY